jgi:hypothetical protein
MGHSFQESFAANLQIFQLPEVGIITLHFKVISAHLMHYLLGRIHGWVLVPVWKMVVYRYQYR